LIKRINIIFFLLLIFSTGQAQTSRLTINLSRAPGFYNKIIASTLIVPLKNQPNHQDSALMEAVSKYWKLGPFKFITEREFDVIRQNKIKLPNTFYLYNETYLRLKSSRMDWAYTKYFFTTELYGVELMDAPYIEFKLPVKTVKNEVSSLDYSFIFGLVIKQLDYDIQLMGDKEKYSKIERKSLITNNFKKELKEYSKKNMLVSKSDLENYMMNLPDKIKNESQKQNFLNYISSQTRIDTSQIKFVEEKDITNAIYSEDKNSLIYTGFTVYNASDGKMLRRIDVSSKERKKHAVYTGGLSIFIVAASLMFFFIAGS